jgi:hypothetical protein
MPSSLTCSSSGVEYKQDGVCRRFFHGEEEETDGYDKELGKGGAKAEAPPKQLESNRNKRGDIFQPQQ